ncbi:hypothetical protein KLP28_13615 [Nocardioidaceae bacterium]|nr:hypothetical protein KLP28_13615 [Nocardioidaceae bacterium]
MMGLPGPRDLYDKVEKAAGPRAREVTHSDQFAQAASVVAGLNHFVRGRVNRVAAKAWHTLNLPAGTDVQKLNNRLGALDRQVRLLTMELERERGKAPRKDAD